MPSPLSVARALAPHRAVLLTAALLLLGLVLVPVRLGPPGANVPWALGAAFIVAIALPHLPRHHGPLAATATAGLVAVVEVVVTGSLSVGSLIILGDIVYVVAVRVPGRWVDVSAIAVASLAGIGLAGVLFGEVRDPVLALVVTVGVVLSSTVWWGREIRRPQLVAERERERADAIADAALAREREAVTAERLRLARELHDAVASSVSAIALGSTGALSAREADVGRLRGSLEDARALSLSALDELRDMIDVLRDPDGEAGSAAVPDVTRVLDVARSRGVDVLARIEDAALPSAVAAAVARIVQESITNATRHAPGVPIAVDVATEHDAMDHGDSVAVRIVNDIPRDAPGPTIGTGSGVIGMRERVRLLGGEFSAGLVGDQWHVEARLPLRTVGTAGRT